MATSVSALFQGAGNIGIGLTNPNVTLTINGQLSATGSMAGNQNIIINNSLYNQASMALVNYLGTCAILATDVNNWNNSLRIADSRDASYPNTVSLYSNNNIRMFVAANGNVKIGADSNPQAKLDVDGDVKANNIPKFAWARFNGSGLIQASFGVTSITPNSPNSNVYIVDVTAAGFSNANYSITGMTRYNGTSCFMQLYTGDGSSTAFNPTTTRFYVATNNSSVGQVNHTNYIQVMGN